MLELKTLYDTDFNIWVESQVEALKAQRLQDLDLPNLIEEIEDLARRDKKFVRSHLKIIFIHLLKWQLQEAKRSSSWKASISNARTEIEDTFLDSPSLRNYLPTVIDKVYASARKVAADQTTLAISIFPKDCPYELSQALDLDFLP